MLHIILTLLKIIGIFFLILLLLLIVLVLLILAAPFSYHISGSWEQGLRLQGRFYWLYRILSVRAKVESQKETKLEIFLFGRPLGKKKEDRKEKQTAQQKKVVKVPSETVEASWNEQKEDEKISQIKQLESDPKYSTEKSPKIPENRADVLEPGEEKQENILESLKKEEQESVLELLKEEEQEDAAEALKEADSLDSSEIEKSEEERELSELLEADSAGPSQKEARTIAGNSWMARLEKLWEFLQQPSVVRLRRKIWRRIRGILRHLRPSALQICARIGTGDPFYTGKIMEAAAVLYAFYGDRIQIQADFDEKALEGEFSLRGWLVPGYLLICAIRIALPVLLSRDCRTFYRNLRSDS